ncbi:MAG: nucleotidyltransferase family protein [Patescibacteria group bacterium]|nr:nucleotidyltransferase family protein [Patescibacteria group bacterium]
MIAGLILAAGESRRMQSPKSLLPIENKTFIEHIIDILQKGCADPVVVILGHNADQIQKAAKLSGTIILNNPDYPLGQLTSIQCGVKHLMKLPVVGVLICPVDCPLISASLIQRLIHESEKNEREIIIPTYEGRRGHPGLFMKSRFQDILDAPLNQGARWVIQRHPEEIKEMATEEEGVILNINTPDDYKIYIGDKR